MNWTLNYRDLRCPAPIDQLSLAVKEAFPGDELVVEATDPAFESNLRTWSEKTGHAVEGFEEDGDVLRARVRVA